MNSEPRTQSYELPESVSLALGELKRELSGLYGKRLRKIYLYGSYARGTADEDSDVDVLVVLEGAVKPGAEISRMSAIASRISLHYDLLLSTFPASAEWLEGHRDSFLENACREAMPL